MTKRHKLLIVDDAPTMRALIKVHLSGLELDLIEACDGEEGLEKARRERPDMIISDIKMPKMDGMALCRAVRADKLLKETPVIVLTTEDTDKCFMVSRAAGASCFLGKPVESEVLRDRVESFLKSVTTTVRRTLLVVDDSPTIRALVKVHLAGLNLHTIEASDGLEALKLAREERPDVIVADIKMPNMDGITFCRTLREDPDFKDTPIVILTSESTAEAAAEAKAAGASCFLSKPIASDELHQKVAAFLSSKA